MSPEDALRSTLRRAADDLGDPVVPHRVLSAGLRRTACGRARRRAGFAVVGALVAAVVVAVPAGLGALSGGPPVVAAPSVPAVDVLAGPTRGSLAEDQAFLDGLVQQAWTVPDQASGDAPVAAVDTRRVVFAGDVPEGRWALVVGENPAPSTLPAEQQTDLGALSSTSGVWFVGPVGAAPDQMEPVSYPRGLAPDQVQSLSDPDTGVVVILAAPGDVVAFSDRPVVAGDGTVSRTWQDAAARDGLAVGRFGTTAVATSRTAGHFRVTRDGIEVTEQTPDQFSSDEGVPVVPIEIEYPRGQVPGADLMDQQKASDVLGVTGLGADQVRFEVIWSGPVPGPDANPTWASFMVATLPSGARIVQGSDVQLLSAGTSATQGSTYGGGQSVFQVLPAGGPAVDLVVPMRTDISGAGGRDTVSSLVVAIPDQITQVTAVDDAGSALAVLPVVGGAAVAPFPEGTTAVEVRSADGGVQVVPLSTYTGSF